MEVDYVFKIWWINGGHLTDLNNNLYLIGVKGVRANTCSMSDQLLGFRRMGSTHVFNQVTTMHFSLLVIKHQIYILKHPN